MWLFLVAKKSRLEKDNSVAYVKVWVVPLPGLVFKSVKYKNTELCKYLRYTITFRIFQYA